MIELSNSKKTFLGTTPEGRSKWSLDCSIGAVQFREHGGEWQDIDPSIEEADSEGFSVKFTQTPYLGRIGEDSHRRIYPDRTDLSYWIEFDKPYPSMGTPSRSDRWFYWDFPNAKMGIRFGGTAVKFGFRLKNASAPTSITIPFTTQGITREGRFLYHGEDLIAELRKPIATDANEEERECEVSFGTGELTISLDTTGLTFPIDIDPTLDLQVGANLDDVHENAGDGTVFNHSSLVIHRSQSSIYRLWGAHRWTDISIPEDATIDVAYAKLYVPSDTNDDINGNWHFEDGAFPAQFVVETDNVTARGRTTASVEDKEDSCGVGWHQTPELKAVLQEVVDDYSPTVIALIFRPNQDELKNFYSTSHNSDPDLAAKLHIEWTAVGEVVEGAASLSGAGTLTASGTATTLHEASATLSGTGDLSASTQTILTGGGTLGGIGELVAPTQVIRSGSATLSGVGTLETLSVVVRVASVSLSGAGTLSSASQAIRNGNAELQGIGTLAAAGEIGAEIEGSASLSGVGTITTSAFTILSAELSISGIGIITVSGTISGILEGAATLPGVGTLSITASVTRLASLSITGQGQLQITGVRILSASASITGIGTLVASGSIGALLEGGATISGVGTLAVTILLITQGQATLTGIGTLSAQALLTLMAAASILGEGFLIASGTTALIRKQYLTAVMASRILNTEMPDRTLTVKVRQYE